MEFSGHGLDWFINYLSNCTQCVIADCCKSEYKEFSGVPQGSILGPLLFILYINNIGDHIETADVHFFMQMILFFIQVVVVYL